MTQLVNVTPRSNKGHYLKGAVAIEQFPELEAFYATESGKLVSENHGDIDVAEGEYLVTQASYNPFTGLFEAMND